MKFYKIIKLISAFILILLFPYRLHSTELSLPLDCTIGTNCFIQNYVDMSKGKERSDYNCGILSYDKHKGTDFSISTKDDFNVLAAATGKVVGTRNNIEDINFKLRNPDIVMNVECGNGVLIQHENGWETQYCHMKQGSITIKVGQLVNKGDVLGKVGLSGFTEFKHLHLSVRKDGIAIDPFSSQAMESGCKGNKYAANGLWKHYTALDLKYTDSAIVDFGIKDEFPISEFKARNGDYNKTEIRNNSNLMLFWMDLISPQKGDLLEVSVKYPNNRSRNLNVKVDQTKVRRFQYFGIKKTTPKWEDGIYQLTYKLRRNGRILSEKELNIKVE